MAHNHEQLERAHSICLASHQRIIAAIESPLAAHELLFSPHIFIWDKPLVTAEVQYKISFSFALLNIKLRFKDL